MNKLTAVGVLTSLGGLIDALEMTIEDRGDGYLAVRMPVTRAMGGSPGVAHGGAVMSLLDTALGGCAIHHALARGKFTSTVEMKVNFLKPAKVGSRLLATATLQAGGRSLLVISGEAVEEDTGRKSAFATGTFNLYDPNRLWKSTDAPTDPEPGSF